MAHPRLVKGPYLGDVTALCFVNLPRDAALPSVLTGTGALVCCYDVETGERHFSAHVFDGIRVHGIVSVPSSKSEGSATDIVAVHGERRVKLFQMSFIEANGMSFSVWQTLPRFSKWVMDVRVVKNDNANKYLVVGLSDNAVCLWDLSLRQIVHHVHCSESCLLYSMRLWGSSIQTLRVASGTIFNELVIWTAKVVEPTQDFVKAKVQPICKLSGHEGSIYRIAWSEDGEYLGSVSDDRSARIWKFSATSEPPTVLFGHTARVWDLHIDEKLFITASEDCTCGIWSRRGELLTTLKCHVGRGVWRCIFTSKLALMVSAGADASVKLHSLKEWHQNPDKHANSSKDVKTLQISCGKTKSQRDSKSEYVRCMDFLGPSSLLIATNNGFLNYVKFSESGITEQASVFRTTDWSPIVCLDVIVSSGDIFIALGDGQGLATVLKTAERPSSELDIIWQSTWSSEAERQLLGVFWCRSLDSRFVFTTDPKGGVRCWVLDYTIDDDASRPRLIAYFKSSLSSRVVCMDASFHEQVLVCGDQKGNLTFFRFDKHFLDTESTGPFSEQDSFRGAHGVSAVASVTISPGGNGQTKILSTGRDGCICEVVREKSGDGTSHSVYCTRVEKVAAITVIESGSSSRAKTEFGRRMAVGFAAAYFVLWDITNDVELKRILCGGWKRPHSFLVGDFPETQFCFAFVKDQEVCIHYSWQDKDRGLQKALQKQSHGREIHAVLLAPTSELDVDWLFTGSEDGTVQITRCLSSRDELSSFSTLDEHVGGSAVRALALSTSVYSKAHGTTETCQTLLFSAGAKEVLTCWLLENSTENISARWLSTFHRRTVQKDDLRYLTLTVFAVSDSRGVPVYFVVSALSNAVVTVKAFDYSSKAWHHVAILEYHQAPVLTLHHVVLSDGVSENRFFVFSGSTDGTVAVWELTQAVHNFLESGELNSEDQAELRPRSGRGSQGGKARYRLRHLRNATQSSNGTGSSSTATDEATATLTPVFLLPSCHQSGVNALHASPGTRPSTLFIVSGGDDQAIHYTILLVEGSSFEVSSSKVCSNAHSSAVKGIWTTNDLVFSTGLDQRLRCWHFQDNDLVESTSCVIDVPEVETLHARSSLEHGDSYRIAVAGRGLQIVKLTT